MKTNKIKQLISGVLLSLVMVFIAWPATTHAQVRVIGPRRVVIVRQRSFFPHAYGYPYYVSDPIAYQKEMGYNDGLSKGKSDARHGMPDDPGAHKHFSGSNSLAYREGFQQGYEDGYHAQGG